jgi:hypothetical protein
LASAACALVLWPFSANAARPTEADAETTLRYELRAGDDPSRVAQMFRIPLDELLRRNGIRDPSRLKVGTVLDIPDPRATLVRDLRTEQDRLRAEVAAVHDAVDREQARVARLESDLRRTAGDRDALAARLTFYRAGSVVGGVAVCAALLLGATLVLALARLRRETARRATAIKHGESLRAAVDRYRTLGAQLELKYQGLYRQAASDAGVQEASQGLRAAYDDERAALDATIEQRAAALREEEATSTRRRKHHEAA